MPRCSFCGLVVLALIKSIASSTASCDPPLFRTRTNSPLPTVLGTRGGANVIDSHSSSSARSRSSFDEAESAEKQEKKEHRMINFIFSDVDGTLVHYPDVEEEYDGKDLLRLPPSSTGMRGVISSRTLALVTKIREHHDIKFVLVSGMRTTTMMKRLPYLPRADAYCSEAGGRIFYPVDLVSRDSYGGPIIYPQRYHGALDSDILPFGLEEDMEWRAMMEAPEAAGKDGYTEDGFKSENGSLVECNGALWKFACALESRGFVIDHKGYASCFRVNRKQQDRAKISNKVFDSLVNTNPPAGLARSVNLGCVDFYPEASGKRNCCMYIANKFTSTFGLQTRASENELLSEAAVCLCDDDNDLQMALACSHAYVPGITSASMERVSKENPRQFTVTEEEGRGISGTAATEKALDLILDALVSTLGTDSSKRE